MNDNTTARRRHNLLALVKQHEERQVAAGDKVAMSASFAASIGMHVSLVSHLKNARPISDKNARQIESRLALAAGWMDQVHDEVPPPTPAEQHFLDLCLRAYRATNAKGRRELLKTMSSGLE